MSIDFNEIRELIAAIAQTDITELTLKSENFELTVRKSVTAISAATPEVISQVVTPPSKPVIVPTTPPEAAPPPAADRKWIEITSPMVGTFYRASGPDESPFVEIGDRISQGQTVCIVEAMKLMNEIEAEISGQVMDIVVENGQPVEYGQTLMWVNPD